MAPQANRVALLVLLCALASAPLAARASILDNIGNAFEGAWDKVKGWTTGAAKYVECKTITEWKDVDTGLQQCRSAAAVANATTLCTPSCNATLHVLSGANQACLDRFVQDFASANGVNSTTTQAFEQQVGECGLTYAPPSSALRLGGLLLPLVVLAVSMAVVEMLHP
ncbi:major surface protein [Micractinium conductrix]|uniref:Major surface protein n=1 Tax=Micractinium conductrix TaxID=554055 RepID=A0A2P6V9F3_9CHLO|nr:major surface protein [Micractinium conductrix]|eukprot:PSC70719.1 major surface protein [Micractinium conductrix]